MLTISKYTRYFDFDKKTIVYNVKNGGQVVVSNDDLNYQDIKYLKEGKYDLIENKIIKDVFCIEDNIDETKVILSNFYKNYFDPTHLSFIIMPNNTCNFACKYCYQEHDKKWMSEDIVNNFIHAIKNYYYETGLRYFYIEWFGGEPLMSFKIIKKITNELSSFFKENNVKFHYGITTNGSLLSKKIVDYLLTNKFDFFQITIDGNKETHNLYRPYANKKGSYDDILNNLLYMQTKEENFDVAIRINYDLKTCDTIDELLDFIKKNFDNRFSTFYHPIGKWGGKNDDKLDVLTGNISNVALCTLIDESNKRGINSKLNFLYLNPFYLICYAGMPYFFTLGSDGYLRKCNEEDCETDKYNIIGDIHSGKLIFDINKWSKFVLPSNDEKCLKCFYFPICLGLNCPISKITNQHECPNTLNAYEDILLLKYNFRRFLNDKKSNF